MKTLFLLISLLVLLAVGCCQAQEYIPWETDEPSFYFRAGAAFPIGDTVNSVEPIIGIGYETVFSEADERNRLGVSFDYIPFTAREVGSLNTHTVNMFPLFAYYKRMSLYGNYRVWTSLGIGAFLLTDDIPEIEFSSGGEFAWKVEIGIDLAPEIFFDGRFMAGQNPEEDGIAVAELGYRF